MCSQTLFVPRLRPFAVHAYGVKSLNLSEGPLAQDSPAPIYNASAGEGREQRSWQGSLARGPAGGSPHRSVWRCRVQERRAFWSLPSARFSRATAFPGSPGARQYRVAGRPGPARPGWAPGGKEGRGGRAGGRGAEPGRRRAGRTPSRR